MGHRIHHLELITDTCVVRAKLNDLPVAQLVAKGDQLEWFAPPINPYLIGDNNIITIEVMPFITEDGSPTDLGEAEINVAVRHYADGEPVVAGQGDALFETEFHTELRERIRQAQEDDVELELPQEFLHVFDNPAPDFTAELSDAEPFDDLEALRDYAIHLRDLVDAGDVDALMVEFEPKIQAYMAAYDEPRDPFADSLRENFVEFLAENPNNVFERDAVELESCCGGRVWWLRQPGGAPLLHTHKDPDGNHSYFDVLVGQRDGALRVVR